MAYEYVGATKPRAHSPIRSALCNGPLSFPGENNYP